MHFGFLPSSLCVFHVLLSHNYFTAVFTVSKNIDAFFKLLDIRSRRLMIYKSTVDGKHLTGIELFSGAVRYDIFYTARGVISIEGLTVTEQTPIFVAPVFAFTVCRTVKGGIVIILLRKRVS